MDGVDHRFKQNQPTGWQAETRANHYAVVDVTGEAAFNRRDRSLVGVMKQFWACQPLAANTASMIACASAVNARVQEVYAPLLKVAAN
jgi:hypothetical protein